MLATISVHQYERRQSLVIMGTKSGSPWNPSNVTAVCVNEGREGAPQLGS